MNDRERRRRFVENLHSCECGRICGYCGEREADHQGDTKVCPPGDRPEDTFCDGYEPDTYDVEVSPPTMMSPAEDALICERCRGER